MGWFKDYYIVESRAGWKKNWDVQLFFLYSYHQTMIIGEVLSKSAEKIKPDGKKRHFWPFFEKFRPWKLKWAITQWKIGITMPSLLFWNHYEQDMMTSEIKYKKENMNCVKNARKIEKLFILSVFLTWQYHPQKLSYFFSLKSWEPELFNGVFRFFLSLILLEICSSKNC